MSNKNFHLTRANTILTLLYFLRNDKIPFNDDTSKYYLFRIKRKFKDNKQISNLFTNFDFYLEAPGIRSQSLDEDYAMLHCLDIIYNIPTNDGFYNRLSLSSAGHDFVKNKIKPHIKSHLDDGNPWNLHEIVADEDRTIGILDYYEDRGKNSLTFLWEYFDDIADGIKTTYPLGFYEIDNKDIIDIDKWELYKLVAKEVRTINKEEYDCLEDLYLIR